MASQRFPTQLEQQRRDSPYQQIQEGISFEIGEERTCEDIKDSVILMSECLLNQIAAAIQQELASLSSSKNKESNPMCNYNVSVTNGDNIINPLSMNTQNPILDKEVSRILHSQTSNELVSQLKYFNSYQNKIQEELMAKTTQINKLQNYLREEINNIQKIVDQNNKIKRQLDVAKKSLQVKNQQYEYSLREIQTLTQINKESSQIIKRLEERVNDLQLENQMLQHKHQQEKSTQTDLRKEENSNNTSSLLNKIASLEEQVMQLKYQKNQLQHKLNSIDQNMSSIDSAMLNQNDTSLQNRKLTTAVVLSMITENELKELRFKGQMFEGQKQGKGTCEYQEGIVYQGQFHQGKRHGFGVIIIDQHILYRGQWKNNLIQGKGLINNLQGEIQSYEGHFSQGRLEGYGSMKLKSGKRITALWKDGRIVGNCLQMFGQSKRYRKPELIECY